MNTNKDAANKLIDVLSCEWILKRRSNGGTAVLIRSIMISVGVFLFAIALQEILLPRNWWTFDATRARTLMSDRIPWLGAIFAATYLALYARFTAQWSYLASLYNQIMNSAHQSRTGVGKDDEVLNRWWAAFMEDAMELHLAYKPMFAPAMASLLADDDIRLEFQSSSIAGVKRSLELACRLRQVDETLIAEDLIEKIRKEQQGAVTRP